MLVSTTAHADHSAFAALDDAKPNRFQLKIMFVSGMGFFTDAYDLFVIGIVVKIVTDQWHLDSSQTALLASSTLAASAVGALVFGRIADMFGRKRIYGLEVLILAAGAIASAFAPSITWLIIFRCILGIGIGGDYPVSATIMSEYAGTQEPRPAGRTGVLDAGRRTHLRAAVRRAVAWAWDQGGRCLADPARVRGCAGTRRLLPAPPDPRDASLCDGRRRHRRNGRSHRAGHDWNRTSPEGRIEGRGAPELHRRLGETREQPDVAQVAGRRGDVLVPARLRLLRQHDRRPGDRRARYLRPRR